MSAPGSPSDIQTSDSQGSDGIKVSQSQPSDNVVASPGEEDQDRMPSRTAFSTENQEPSTTSTQQSKATGLQHLPSQDVGPARPTTPPNQQFNLTARQEMEQTTEDTGPASANRSSTATTGNNGSSQAADEPESSKTQTDPSQPAAAPEPVTATLPSSSSITAAATTTTTTTTTITPADGELAYDEATAGPPSAPLPPHDWTSLFTRYEAALAPLRLQEDALTADFEAWTKLFHNWTLSGRRKEEARAAKRLRTQIAYVQMAEDGFEARRVHYEKCKSQAESLLKSLREDV